MSFNLANSSLSITVPFLSVIVFANFNAILEKTGHNIAMMLKSLTKNPVLMIGILMMSIFLMQLYRSDKLGLGDKRKATSCVAVQVRLEKRVPGHWKLECDGNNLLVWISTTYPFKDDASRNQIEAVIMKEIANVYITVAKKTIGESLEKTESVSVRISDPKMTVGAWSEGRMVSKLRTLTDNKLIFQHIANTIKVRTIK